MATIVAHHPRHVIRRASLALCTLLLFVVALVVGALVHLNTPTGRQLVMKEVNALLAPSFKGKITLRRLDGVGLSGVRGVDATIEDPSGRDVVRVRGARAGIFAWAAVQSALLDHEGPLVIRLRDIHIDDVDVRLDTDRPAGSICSTPSTRRFPAATHPTRAREGFVSSCRTSICVTRGRTA